MQDALRELTLALAAYPGDQRFIQAKTEVEARLRQFEEERQREREKVRQLELERTRIGAAQEERKRKEAAERERTRQEEEERKNKKALEQERIHAKQDEQGRTAPLDHERQLAVHRREEKGHLHPPKENQAQQPKVEPEPLAPLGSSTNPTRLFGAQTSTESQHAESRDAEKPTGRLLPLLARELFGSSEKQSTTVSSKREGPPADQKIEQVHTSISIIGWDSDKIGRAHV